MPTELYKNSIFEVWPDTDSVKEEDDVQPKLLRVLWLNDKVVVTIDVEDDVAQPEVHDRMQIEDDIEEGLIHITTYFIPRIMLSDEKLKPKDIQIRDKVWGYLEPAVTGRNVPLIFKKSLRGVIVEELSKEFKVSETLIRKNLRKYWQRGMTVNALLPDYPNCGGRGRSRDGLGKKLGAPNQDGKTDPDLVGINVTEEIRRDHFRPSIKLWYNKRDKRTLYEVYELMLRRYYKAGIDANDGIFLKPEHERPTFRQFYYWFRKEREISKEYEKRYGQRRVNLKHRGIEGIFNDQSLGPGSLYQIDATVANIYLVHRKNREWVIGRPIIYFVVDVFSRLIAGLYVGLEGPSWAGAALALENAASDKVEYCKSFNIDITPEEWPSFGLPERLTTDRGEYVGNKPAHLIKTLNVKLEHLPAYRPDWKPFVEKQFDVSNNTYIRWTPGNILERMRERGDSDPKQRAMLDIHEFETIMIEYVRYHNSHYLTSYRRSDAMVKDDVKPTPVELWHWGRKKQLGALGFCSKEDLRLNLLPSKRSRFTASGIRFLREHYTCNTAEEESWRFRARNGEKIDVEFSFDPRDTTKIYVRHEDGNLEECYRVAEEHIKFVPRNKEVRWEEQWDIIAYEARLARKGRGENTEKKLNTIEKFKGVVKGAKQKTGGKDKNTVDTSNVKAYRKFALEEEREERRTQAKERLINQQSSNVVVFPTGVSSSGYVAPKDQTDLLRQALEEED